jgi:hypothetical protein
MRRQTENAACHQTAKQALLWAARCWGERVHDIMRAIDLIRTLDMVDGDPSRHGQLRRGTATIYAAAPTNSFTPPCRSCAVCGYVRIQRPALPLRMQLSAGHFRYFDWAICAAWSRRARPSSSTAQRTIYFLSNPPCVRWKGRALLRHGRRDGKLALG